MPASHPASRPTSRNAMMPTIKDSLTYSDRPRPGMGSNKQGACHAPLLLTVVSARSVPWRGQLVLRHLLEHQEDGGDEHGHDDEHDPRFHGCLLLHPPDDAARQHN